MLKVLLIWEVGKVLELQVLDLNHFQNWKASLQMPKSYRKFKPSSHLQAFRSLRN